MLQMLDKIRMNEEFNYIRSFLNHKIRFISTSNSIKYVAERRLNCGFLAHLSTNFQSYAKQNVILCIWKSITQKLKRIPDGDTSREFALTTYRLVEIHFSISWMARHTFDCGGQNHKSLEWLLMSNEQHQKETDWTIWNCATGVDGIIGEDVIRICGPQKWVFSTLETAIWTTQAPGQQNNENYLNFDMFGGLV